MIIGVTGLIGSGKSRAVCFLSDILSAAVLDTDTIAKSLYRGGNPVFEKIKAVLGSDIETESGPDLRMMAERMYRNPEKKKKTEDLVHPEVWRTVREKAAACDGYCLVETALPGKDFFDICDIVLLISSDEEIRKKRIMEKRQYSREKAESIISSQNTGNIKYDYEIYNNSSEEEFLKALENFAALISDL